jgi:hypothetical protein
MIVQNLNDYIKLPKHVRQQHLDLTTPCIIRGTTSTHCRGILAHVLDTDMNTVKVDCCHACNNEACSNPKHLYWGTRSENVKDFLEANPNARKQTAARGENNGNYGVKPWRNSAISIHPSMVLVWSKCIYLYEEYYLKNWNFSKYGHGESYFEKKYRIFKS